MHQYLHSAAGSYIRLGHSLYCIELVRIDRPFTAVSREVSLQQQIFFTRTAARFKKAVTAFAISRLTRVEPHGEEILSPANRRGEPSPGGVRQRQSGGAMVEAVSVVKDLTRRRSHCVGIYIMALYIPIHGIVCSLGLVR